MTSYYRTWSSLGLLVGTNIIARILNIDIMSNLLFGNHLVESLMFFSFISLLIDIGLLKQSVNKDYFKIFLIALFGGVIFINISFSSLFSLDSFVAITSSWFDVAPIMIGLVGIPSLYFATKLSQRETFLGIKRSLFNVFMVSLVYSALMIYLLIKYNILTI